MIAWIIFSIFATLGAIVVAAGLLRLDEIMDAEIDLIEPDDLKDYNRRESQDSEQNPQSAPASEEREISEVPDSARAAVDFSSGARVGAGDALAASGPDEIATTIGRPSVRAAGRGSSSPANHLSAADHNRFPNGRWS